MRTAQEAPNPAERAESTTVFEQDAFIVCENLVKIYKVAELEVVALQGLDLTIQKGELMGIVGNSGSGKSTLLNILGGLDRPSAGRVIIGGRDFLKMSEFELVRYKRERVGFVWQQTSRNLIPYLTALENVELPMTLAGRIGPSKRRWAEELLDQVGLGHRKRHRLSQLSGGEQQRVAIAISLANKPDLLLADEPTGEVDSANSTQIFEIFRRLNTEYGTTVVIVTHDRAVASKVNRVVAIRDGRTSTETVRRVDEEEQVHHDEFVVLDGAGRLQLPKDFLEQLNIKDRVKVEINDDHIEIRRPSWGWTEAEQK